MIILKVTKKAGRHPFSRKCSPGKTTEGGQIDTHKPF